MELPSSPHQLSYSSTPIKYQNKKHGELEIKIYRTCEVLQRPAKTTFANGGKKGYLSALRERHNLTHKAAKFQRKVEDVAIIRTDKNSGTWPLAIVSEIYPGKDGIIRGVKLKTAQGTLE